MVSYFDYIMVSLNLLFFKSLKLVVTTVFRYFEIEYAFRMYDTSNGVRFYLDMYIKLYVCV
jgi:hypothetical protein